MAVRPPAPRRPPARSRRRPPGAPRAGGAARIRRHRFLSMHALRGVHRDSRRGARAERCARLGFERVERRLQTRRSASSRAASSSRDSRRGSPIATATRDHGRGIVMRSQERSVMPWRRRTPAEPGAPSRTGRAGRRRSARRAAGRAARRARSAARRVLHQRAMEREHGAAAAARGRAAHHRDGECFGQPRYQLAVARLAGDEREREAAAVQASIEKARGGERLVRATERAPPVRSAAATPGAPGASRGSGSSRRASGRRRSRRRGRADRPGDPSPRPPAEAARGARADRRHATRSA
jgi:hypothetical protein